MEHYFWKDAHKCKMKINIGKHKFKQLTLGQDFPEPLKDDYVLRISWRKK